VPDQPVGADTDGSNKDLAFLGCVVGDITRLNPDFGRPTAGTRSSGSRFRHRDVITLYISIGGALVSVPICTGLVTSYVQL